ncbi:MAG: HAD family hydrolase [Dehalococcoidales bacterium]|nr:HAD family hydrolase [Dehalococcoidales bacterium]
MRFINQKYKAVIFDLFGTLIENFSRSEYAAVFREMAEVLSVPADEFLKDWAAAFDQRATGVFATTADTIKNIAVRFNTDVTDEQIEHASRIRTDYTRRSIIPRESAIEVLEHLKESEFKTALISDCTCEIPGVWDSTPLAPYFDVAVFSCVVHIKKPDPRIYHTATEQMGVNPQDCLYIGDGSSHELTGARAVGMHPILIRDPGESDDTHFIDREETWDGPQITSLKEVFDLLLK